jgi:diguanylate cyclase (GGDEF)-like protein/PAS domain S-box-containing protein
MFRVINCLTVDHDWRLVVLAGAICLLASIVVISLFHRAQATQGRTRLVWLSLDAAAAGCGIWGTHFIAMLAYDPGAGAAYDLSLTLLSLVFAAAITGIGLGIALRDFARWSPIFGGAAVGGGVAAMHYTGMMALELPGRILWSPALVTASIVLGVALGSASLFVAARRDDWTNTLLAAVLLTLAIVSHHFTAMGAVVVMPDPTRFGGAHSLSPTSLSLVVAAIAITILGMCLVASVTDRHSKDKLRQQKVLLDAALQNMSQGLCMFDAQGRIILFNERYTRMMGLSAASLQGRSLLDLFKHRKATGEFVGDPENFFAQVLAEARAGKSGTKVMETETGRALRVADQPLPGGGWIATFEDITDWRKAQAQIAYMAHHDALTDLPNRTLFRQQLEQSLHRVKRDEQVAVLCLDLDHFKEVNDTLGHPIGDDLLRAVALRLKDCLREGDTVSRLGGDEFAIVQLGSQQHASEALASRLVEVIGAPYDIQGHQVVIGTSIGISMAPDDGVDPDQLLKNADMALYRAKGDGRGTYRFFEIAMDARAQARRLMELELRAALLRDEFEVYYQPIHDIQADQIVCFEALVRWNHPLRGMIAPATFIPLAEATGLIVPLGDWVLRKACADAAGWSRDVQVAVNLSPAQFKNRHLVTSVQSALSAAGLDAHRLELEITESVLLQDSEATLATLHTLRKLGVRISMDDFGTGYSSLSYLRSFPFDKIKIDRSFIHELATRDDSMAIVRAVTGLGKSLGISTTAEGVETSEQLALLRSEGCTEVQGYLFNPARPAAEVEKMLSKGPLRIVA